MKQQLNASGKKLRLSNVQRRSLAKKAKALDWATLQTYASLVTPVTLMAWHRKLIALKYTANRILKTDRQKRMEVIQGLLTTLKLLFTWGGTAWNDQFAFSKVIGQSGFTCKDPPQSVAPKQFHICNL